MLLHNLKKKLAKFYTAISTIIVIAILFVLQFIVIQGNLGFWKDSSFWMDLAVMVAILLIANEIYWKNGNARGELNDKYVNSIIEYSVRVNRLKNYEPSLTEDFYKYIDEKNIELYIEARHSFLEKYGISKQDYYYGVYNGTEYSTPHCELTEHQLKKLKRKDIDGTEVPYYTKHQVKALIKAIQGKFNYEVLSGTEILSSVKFSNKKYATSYDGKKNKWDHAKTNMVTTFVVSFIGALFGADLVENGWSVSALFVFLYRLFMLAWRAMLSNEAGYADIVETKRGVNVNRSNILTMYATSRGFTDLFKDVNAEITQVKNQYIRQEIDLEDENSGN